MQFNRDLLERLRSAPGVKSAAMAAVSILSGNEWDSSTSVEGHRAADGEDMQAFMNALSPGYFETMRIPILEGRDFRQSDLVQQPTVAIVNRRFAEHFFKGKSAVGKRLGRGGGPNTKLTIEIIGVVADSLYEGPREGVRRQVFVPNWGRNSAAFYVRAQTGSASAFNLIRNEVKQLDSSMPVYSMKTVEGQLDETLLTDRLIALLSAGFGLLATVLASIGLYGVMAFVVARRRKELGIRLALGAQPGLVIWMVMREVLLLLSIGLAIGIPSAMALARFVAAQLYGIEARDPWMAGSTMALLIVVSTIAGLIPAYRASRIDPILASAGTSRSRLGTGPYTSIPLRRERLVRHRIGRHRRRGFPRVELLHDQHHAVHPDPVPGKRAHIHVLARLLRCGEREPRHLAAAEQLRRLQHERAVGDVRLDFGIGRQRHRRRGGPDLAERSRLTDDEVVQHRIRIVQHDLYRLAGLDGEPLQIEDHLFGHGRDADDLDADRTQIATHRASGFGGQRGRQLLGELNRRRSPRAPSGGRAGCPSPAPRWLAPAARSCSWARRPAG